MIVFEKPIGAHADCKELEYISALHQSGPMLRQDASISAQDVVNFLVSRHGIKVDLAYVEKNLMPGLAGAIDDSPSAVFDLVELASILLFPHLRKTGAGNDAELLFDEVRKMIMLDVTGSTEPVPLNRQMMVKIMKTYGEDDVSSAVVEEMLKAAGVKEDGTTIFDYTVLVNATTSDIQQYDMEWENRETTYYDDVLDGTALDANLEDNNPDEELAKSNFDEALDKISRLFTLPTIDSVAENYRSKTFNSFLWVLVVVAFFAYAFEFKTSLGQQDCTTSFMSEFGCRIANSIIAWIVIMVQLVVLGTIFVVLSTAGNSIHLQHDFAGFFGVMVGIATITISCILSYIYNVKFFLINTYKAPDYQYQFVYGSALVLGCFLLLFQIKALLYVLIPRSTWKKLPFSSFWLTCEMAKSECCSKQAAAYKVKNMVDHALALHNGKCLERAEKTETACLKLQGSSLNSSHAKAMVYFHATADHRERVGGVLYTFRKMWNGSLFKEDGVFIHSGLYSMNVAQWFIVIFYVILYTSIDLLIQSFYHPETQAPSVSPSPTTTPSPTMSSAPSVGIEYLVATYVPVLSDAVNTMFRDGGEVFLSVWQSFAASNPDLAFLFVAYLLNSSNPEILQSVASLQQQETLAIFAATLAQTMTNGTTSNSASTGRYLSEVDQQYRYLQEAAATDSSDPDWFPTESEVRVSGSVGCVVAFLAAASLALVLIPSSVSTILQFRCGHMGSLRCRSFPDYRRAPDLTTILFGSAFWGTFYCALSILIIVGILSFVLVWSVTRSFVMNLLAFVIGILVTLAFKIILLIFVRKILFVGFFRKRPIGGNFLMLVLECWSLGLTVGTMLLRMVKLLVISVFYIGRLDTPVFAPGVGMIGPIALDGHPIQFRKGLLLHDAHRHPYMERLGVIYLLKLRYGEHFANRAGGQWRLIFVLALMPWLRRYRLDDDKATSREAKMSAIFEFYDGEIPEDLLEHNQLSALQTSFKKLNDRFGKDEARSFLEGLLLPM